MKLKIDRNIVEFTPETAQETADLEVLWRKLIDCVKDTRNLTPIGEYIPEKKNSAMFVIEGVAAGGPPRSESVNAEDGVYICMTCNKYINVKAGEKVPLCCGREMDSAD